MKKMFLFATLASVALASCTTDESVFDGAKAKGEKIEFVAANYAAQTRAEHDDAAFTNDDYTVWAWENGGNTPYMNAVEVTYADGASTVDGTYYWPNYALDFAAYTPANDARVEVNRTAAGASSVTFTFDNSADATKNDNVTNLMFADFVESQSYDNDTETGEDVVALKFRHVLTRLNVVVDQVEVEAADMPAGIENYNVTVNELSFQNILCEGSLTVDEAYDVEDNALWSAKDGSATADWNIIATDTDVEDDAIFETAYEHGDKNYFVMPQTLSDNVKLYIKYTVTTEFEAAPNIVKTYEKTININTIKSGANAITQWLTNKNVTYTINISPADLKPISFTVNEEEMGAVNGTTGFKGFVNE